MLLGTHFYQKVIGLLTFILHFPVAWPCQERFSKLDMPNLGLYASILTFLLTYPLNLELRLHSVPAKMFQLTTDFIPY